MTTRYRLGIDVGGTFTDFVLATPDGASFSFHKEPSIPSDPSRAVEAGTRHLIATMGIAPGDIELVVHGTTLALNAIIQKNGAKVALVVSAGNRDVMEIARARMPNSYDFTAGREAPLIPRESVFEVCARGTASGAVLSDADPDEIAAVAERIAQGGHQAVAVMLLNSYRDGTLERRVASLLAGNLPLPVVASCDIWPEMREYERALVTAMNAFIHPLMDGYFTRLEERLAGLGVTAPVYITANNGGTVSLGTARARPVDTVLSGPASGVLAATRVAGAHPFLITFDMGGTSTDIAVSEAGELEFTNATHIGDYPLMLPVVNVSAIGSGGGSVVWTDAQGLLKVGPMSAGADPGPVAYGRGGERPAMTDCYLTLGYLDAPRFNDGKMPLDAAAARRALEGVAHAMGLADGEAAASAAVRVATATMATELRKLLAQKGLDPRGFVLVAYGGAGPTHANLLAQEARLEAVLVPRLPGTFCALGAILADVRRDYVRPARTMIGRDGAGWPPIRDAILDMEGEARAWVAEEGDIIGAHDIVLTLDMRYPAQAFELAIRVPHEGVDTVAPQTVIALFDEEHRRLYGFAEDAEDLQITNIRLAVVGKVAPMTLAPAKGSDAPAPRTRRKIVHDGAHEVPVYDRADLGRGAAIEGPAIVEQPDSTVVVLPAWRARVDDFGNLLITRAAP